MSSGGNVARIHPTQAPPTPEFPGGGDGGGSDRRLAAIEARLSSLETELKHSATKEDIQKTKVWVLGGVLGGMAVAAGFAAAIAKLFAG